MTNRYRTVGVWIVALVAVAALATCSRDFGRIAAKSAGGLTVDSVEPTEGSNVVDTAITVRGTGFAGSMEIYVGATLCTSVTQVSATVLTASVPAGMTAGIYDVTAVSSTGASGVRADAFTVIDPGAIQLTSITPAEGLDSEDTAVTLIGASFLPGATATIGDTTLSQIEIVDGSTITAVVPSGLTPDTYDVSVSNSDGSTASLLDGFEVISADAVRIDSVEPSSGENDEDVLVTIIGANFANPVTVFLGGFELDNPEPVFQSTTRVVVTVPAGTTPGVYSMTVVNPDDTSDTREDAYTVLDAGGDDDTDDDTDDDVDDDADDDTADDDTADDDTV
ncbi:MAG: IPT/TIG domain-containing protein [Deltaproteobacteria bacterium]|nr:IPT/TIG domain-containing protein [Deltaproteobacteria bacterium]